MTTETPQRPLLQMYRRFAADSLGDARHYLRQPASLWNFFRVGQHTERALNHGKRSSDAHTRRQVDRITKAIFRQVDERSFRRPHNDD
jgi:hypothetical protein